MENCIKRMQENLLLIRRSAGWSATQLGSRIGVSRQTINNIESGKFKLTQPIYMAIRYVLDIEIKENPDDTLMLKGLLDMLIDNPEKYAFDEVKDLKEEAELISSAISKSKTREDVSKNWLKKAKVYGITTTVISAIALGTWGIISKLKK